ncbi:MAG: sigma-70 family RNA polymerase sigma factor [Micromonosporaceae bacterium]
MIEATRAEAEEASFRALYADQFPPMVRLAYLTTGSLPAAEDVVQDAFVQLHRHRHRVHDPAAWLRRAVVSHCTSFVRRRMLERRHGRSVELVHMPALSADATAVRDAMSRLKPRQRAAVFLRYYLDLPETAIADALGCRKGTVKSLLHRGLAVMKEALDEQ